MLATLPVAASNQTGFSFANLLILAVIVAVLYPVQKKIRDTASRRRRERWAREDREAAEQLRHRDPDLRRDLDGDVDGDQGRGAL